MSKKIEKIFFECLMENDICIKDSDGCNDFDSTKESIPYLIESLKNKGIILKELITSDVIIDEYPTLSKEQKYYNLEEFNKSSKKIKIRNLFSKSFSKKFKV